MSDEPIRFIEIRRRDDGRFEERSGGRWIPLRTEPCPDCGKTEVCEECHLRNRKTVRTARRHGLIT